MLLMCIGILFIVIVEKYDKLLTSIVECTKVPRAIVCNFCIPRHNSKAHIVWKKKCHTEEITFTEAIQMAVEMRKDQANSSQYYKAISIIITEEYYTAKDSCVN